MVDQSLAIIAALYHAPCYMCYLVESGCGRLIISILSLCLWMSTPWFWKHFGQIELELNLLADVKEMQTP